MLDTEKVNEKSRHIGEMTTIDAVRLIQEENKNAVNAVDAACADIAEAVDRIAEKLAAGGHLYYIGCGTSGRIGVMDAAECPPTFGVGPDTVVGIIAGGDTALRRAVEGFEDDPEAGRSAVSEHEIGERDAVIGISASGGAAFVVGALREAKRRGALTISVSSNRGTSISEEADIEIAAETGPEVVNGSTRMKAGTAQKLILNMISTCVMIRLGYVYENYMVNLKPSNKKLRERMISIVSGITGLDREESLRLLNDNDWVIRKAVSVKESTAEIATD